MFIMLIGALNSLQSKSLHKNNCGLQPSTRLGVKYMHEYLKYKIPSLYLKNTRLNKYQALCICQYKYIQSYAMTAEQCGQHQYFMYVAKLEL